MVNKCLFIGMVGKQPEIKTFGSGDKVASFSLATSESWKNKNGEKETRTTWINCEVFGKQVDVVEKYVDKGSKLFIESKLRIDEYEKDGIKRQAYKFIVSNFVMLDSKKDDQTQSSGQHSSMSQSAPSSNSFEDMLDDSEDLPF